MTHRDIIISNSYLPGHCELAANSEAARDFLSRHFGAGCISIDVADSGVQEITDAMRADRLTVGVAQGED